MMKNNKLLFVTGTRADYAKIRPIFKFLYEKNEYNIYLYITGMHLIKCLGSTHKNVRNDIYTNFKNIKLINCKKRIKYKNSMVKNFTLMCDDFEKVIKSNVFDMVFVHGDRLEALSAAIVSSVNNIPVCQIEAGEVSGSIDENIRHSITKFSHKFLVNDKLALNRVMQLGELKENIYIIGPTSIQNVDNKKIYNVLNKYNLVSKKYAILIYHPVTTLSVGDNEEIISHIMKQLCLTDINYIVIYPNNDKYSNEIISIYNKYKNINKFTFYKSLPFDEFKIILENSSFIIGNSSCGLKEAPYYGVPTIDIGIRQANRIYHHNFTSIYHVEELDNICKRIISINKSKEQNKIDCDKTEDIFYSQMQEIFKEDSKFWNINIQKKFYDIGEI